MTSQLKIISKEEYLKKNKKPNQEKVWNKISKPWKKYRQNNISAVEKFLKNKKGKVIDIGCGAGRNMIPKRNLEYTGIDFSKEQLIQAKKNIKEKKIKAKLIKTKASNLSKIKNNHFDYGLFVASLHCIENDKERKKALKEFYRILKPNAKALITTWNSDDKRFSHLKNKGDIYISWKENNILYMRYYYLFEKYELKKLIKNVGFKIIKFNKTKKEEKDRFNRKNWIIEIQKNNKSFTKIIL